VRLLVDECIARGIHQFIALELSRTDPPIQCIHLLDFNNRQGEPDEVWIPKAAAENLIILTGDSGKGKYGAPLHLLAPRYQITSIYLSGKLCQRPGAEKGRAVLSVLPAHWSKVTAAPRGARFRIQIAGRGYALTAWPLSR
jgi:hypothetical protein